MYEIWDIVRMAPDGGSYIGDMRRAFATNPEAKIIAKEKKPSWRYEYRVQDYLGCCWAVVEREIIWLIKPRQPILFL